MDISKKTNNPNPRDSTGPLGGLFFTYTFDIFKKGYYKTLDVDELYDAPKNDRTTLVCGRLERNWNRHLLKCSKEKKNPSLLRVLAVTFWSEFLYLGYLVTTSICCQLTKPVMLGLLLNYFSSSTMSTKSEGLWYAGGYVGFTVITSIAFSQYQINSSRYGMNMRAAVSAMIYRKALRLSRTALGETASGKIVNLLSNDVSRFDYVVLLIHYLWLSPCAAMYITCFLYYEGGMAGIVAMVVFFIFLPIQSYSSRLSAKYRNQTATTTDERIGLMDEVITGVQVIKMYSWEKPFEKLIKAVRRLELKYVLKSLYLRGFFLSVGHVMNRLNLFLTILTMVILGQQITARKVFVFLSYYHILSEVVSNIFVASVAQVAELLVSIRRIQEYLLNEEYCPVVKTQSEDDKVLVSLKKLTVKWNLSSKEDSLTDINLNFNKGKLIGIIGPVGCGKSTLLQTILGELEVISGSIQVNGILSYASQEPWVFAATMRQNITFDSDYDHKRYNQVINACALEKDFKQFKQGDLTIVGDRGASLSGGQKARINLARALYRNADIYLLDDPLSAVDIHVSKHMYDECINGYLANKTKILVTHQVHLLKDADHIVILNKGSIENEGTFKELSNSDNLFAKLLTLEAEVTNTEKQEQTKEVEDKRKKSFASNKSLNSKASGDKEDNEKVNLIDLQEESSKGKVKGSLLWHYLRSGGNLFVVCFVLALFIGSQGVTCGVDYFISYWVNVEESRNILNPNNITDKFNDEEHWSTNNYLYMYAGVLIFLYLINLSRSIFFFKLCIWASQKLHNSMFHSVISASMRFFDTNPSGRILNRFSKDIGSIDEGLPKTMLDCGQGLLMIAGALLLIVVIDAYSLILLVVISIPCLILRRIYLKSSKNIKRLEGIMRSPVFTHLNASIQGLTTIRSFGAEHILTAEFDRYQDYHNSAWFMYITTSSAFGFYLDILSFIFVIVITFNFVIFEEDLRINSGNVGLAVTQATILTGYVQYGIRLSAEVITQLLSVERVLEYNSLPNEKQPEIPKKPPSNWPDKGEIIFKNMCLKYDKDLPLTLKNLNFTILPNEKVGIVGRTGAGKSSIISALFRLTIIEGSIKIDNIDTKDISLHSLRSKISIIPQDPVLFSGTLRYNLDPFEEYSDEVLYKAIEDVELKDPANVINKLENKVMDRGSNYSVGQRQLVCLARAIIRNNKILMLDEATANVDPQTDALIQTTIRKKFADCTVLTVAHRLNTIMDSDKVLVMDSGAVIEYDHPYILLQNPNGIFFKMVEEAGTSISDQLRKISQENYQRCIFID